jgi:DNA-binding transcriptional LysR family regulator
LIGTDELAVFIAAAETGNFARAAKDVAISPASVTRVINSLEAELGVRLFTRSTRQCRLTYDGELFYDRCRPLVHDLRDAVDEIKSGQLGPNGILRISAPISFGRRHIAPMVEKYQRLFPSTSIQLFLTDESDGLNARECDCAIRVGPPEKGNYITRRLLQSRRVVCASPGYLKKHGRPQKPEDLHNHAGLILIRDGSLVDHWMFKVDGVMETVRIPVALASNSGEVTQEWVLSGAGIALKSAWDVEDELASGRLVALLDEYCNEKADIFIVYPDRRNLPLRVRSFIDLASSTLAEFGDRLARAPS